MSSWMKDFDIVFEIAVFFSILRKFDICLFAFFTKRKCSFLPTSFQVFKFNHGDPPIMYTSWTANVQESIVSGIMYWLIADVVIGILFVITGLLIIEIDYQVGKIYRKYCWDIISIMVAIMSTAIVIYFGEWIKSVVPLNLIALLLLVHVIYIGIRCYVKDWREERGYY